VRLTGPLLFATILASAAFGGDGQEAGTAALFEDRVREGEPGLAVLVRQDGKTVFARGYGVRDLRTRAHIDPDTAFRLASVTKPFTAMAVMLLVHDGKLRYDDALTDVFPAFPAYGRAITIRHLLTHTSGLPDYEDLMAQAEKGRGPIWTAEHQIRDDEVLALLRGETKGRFAPGTSWAYSNSGYVVLGLAVARASGKPFGEFLRQRIFAPLEMTHTVAYEKGRNEIERRAYGHASDGSVFRQEDQSATSATLGDGGVYSTLEDLARWDEALQAYELLSPGAMRPALTPVRLADGSEPRWPAAAGGENLDPGRPVSYGFGWFLDPWRGHPRTWHHGSTSGFRSVIERFPDDRLTIVILANRDDLDLRELALEVAGPRLDARSTR
jgi:CubicO group peptidase (beta-lactamase class C family)